jgi:hypothetical protein
VQHLAALGVSTEAKDERIRELRAALGGAMDTRRVRVFRAVCGGVCSSLFATRQPAADALALGSTLTAPKPLLVWCGDACPSLKAGA